MSLNESNSSHGENPNSLPTILEDHSDPGKTTPEEVTTLLGLPKLEFNSDEHISNEVLQECFGVSNMFIKDFDNGYGAIMKYISFNGQQVEMGTGYALVTAQYIKVRGKKQGIIPTKEAQSIGSIWHKDDLGREVLTQIYFVGPATLENGSTTGIAYTNKDMYIALEEILNVEE